MGEGMTYRMRRWAVTAMAAASVAAAGLIGAGSAAAAPSGQVDAGVPFSSAVYGTGCTYQLVVPVNASGMVYFWEQGQGQKPLFIGKAQAYQLVATVDWIPRHQGKRTLYAVQNGVKGPVVTAPVHQGYGSGWACFAL
ncbi:hypothetical protein ACWDPV_05915 [Gordonia sp. NPDC003504]